MKAKQGGILFVWGVWAFLYGDFPAYESNPFAFSIAEAPYFGSFFVADLDNDGLPDFTFRSPTTLYVYDHWGQKRWQSAIPYPCPEINNHGTKHGAADVDGDGQTEIVALDDQAHIHIFDGATGALKRTYTLPPLGPNQLACHIAVVNLRGQGDRDAIVQTCDVAPEFHANANTLGYYFNRSLIALNLETGQVLWRIEQDADPSNGFYEGYWGSAHNAFFACDIDGDGLDEVIGGNLITPDGRVIDLGYPTDWLGLDVPASYADHLDGISVGDIRPDLPGIEWVVTNEDNAGLTAYHTTLMNRNGILWSRQLPEPEVLREAKEPQHTAIGNFDPDKPFAEVWVRSRLGGQGERFYRPYDSQWPWMYDVQGNLYDRVTTYRMVERLPPGFNTHPTEGNKLGIEIIWTIDWDGSLKEYIAGKARFVDGHVAILDVWKTSYQYKLDTVWTTMKRRPTMQCQMVYVADIAGDGREELILYDASDGKIRIYTNPKSNPYPPKPPKWDDPLYRRLKQNWNFYSPGSYTYHSYPLLTNVQISNITASGATITWTSNEPATSQIGFGLDERLGRLTHEDPTLVTQHTFVLDSLERNGVYFIQARSRNAFGKLGLSHLKTFALLRLSRVSVQKIEKTTSNQVRLTWEGMEGVTQFSVYADTTATFFPLPAKRIAERIQDADPSQPGIQWTDPTVGSTRRFYRVCAASGLYEGDPSEPVGLFSYSLVTTEGTDFNLIGLPLKASGLNRANELLEKIPGCNAIARWDAQNQGFEQYIPSVPSTNFNLTPGGVYYANVSSPATFSILGAVERPTYPLLHTAKGSFNTLLIPLERTDLSWASQLASEIPGCDGVVYWDAKVQAFTRHYVPSQPDTDFPIKPGMPYFVSVTANTTWPASAPKADFPQWVVDWETPNRGPHLIWGRETPFGTVAFRAYRRSRPEEVLTDVSPGCALKGGRWQVQCGNFPSGWLPGDTVVVEFWGIDQKQTGSIETVLSAAASDRVEEAKRSNDLPREPVLFPNYPNPFNSETTFSYGLAREGHVRLAIIDLQGRHVKTLFEGSESAGIKTLRWNGTDEQDQAVPSGVYVAILHVDDHRWIQKVLLIR